jgi:predicted glycogen debranching enzyme
MNKLVRKIDLAHPDHETARELLRREWLLTNGLGGYAAGTISGTVTRRHHGLLIAALPAPLGRVVMFNHVAEFVRFPGGRVLQISGEEPARADASASASHYATEFRLENQLPVWRFELEGIVIEKRVLLVHGQNTVHTRYELLDGPSRLRIEVRPSIHFRRHESDVSEKLQHDYLLTISGEHYEIATGETFPPLRLLLHGSDGIFTHDAHTREIAYQIEADRGYASGGLLWSPGYFGVDILPGKTATLVASTEPWKIVHALTPEQALAADSERRRRLLELPPEAAQNGVAAELVLAADQFIITPAGRAGRRR